MRGASPAAEKAVLLTCYERRRMAAYSALGAWAGGWFIPPPRVDSTCAQMLQELPTGARLATMTCYNCWKERKFPTAEFVSFLQSIAAHSPLLARVFANSAVPGSSKQNGSETGGGNADVMGDASSSLRDVHAAENAVGADHTMLEGGANVKLENEASAGRAARSSADADSQMSGSKTHTSSVGVADAECASGVPGSSSGSGDIALGTGGGVTDGEHEGEGGAGEGGAGDVDSMSVPDSNGESESSLLQESETDRTQHQRRLAEIERRRLEGLKAEGDAGDDLEVPHQKKVCRYLSKTLKELAASLPLEARASFMVIVQRYDWHVSVRRLPLDVRGLVRVLKFT